MTPSVRVRSVPQGAYRAYLTKSNECYIDMQNAVKAARWNSAAILAVHTVVSACDALTSFYLRIRCTSERHLDVLTLINRLPLSKPDIDAKSKQIGRVIDIKNKAEYEERLITENEARSAAKDAERVLIWVQKNVAS